MSGLPTLLVKGRLAGRAGAEAPDEVPVRYITRWLKQRMPEFGGAPPEAPSDRVLVVRSETGSGKSTALPVHVFRLLRDEKTPLRQRFTGPGVMCTQPRVLTAQALALDLSESPHYPDMVLGVTVGYQTGPANEKPGSGLIFATAGVLLAQLRTMRDAEIMGRYRFIIVDEAHERSADIDTVLLRLKGLVGRNLGDARLPFIILASATLPVDKYARYFGVGPRNVVEVTGRAFPVPAFFPEVGTNDYPAEAARRAARLHRENPDDPPERADILIFMPGVGEIKAVVEALERENRPLRDPGSSTPPFLVLALSREDVLARSPDFKRLQADPSTLRVPSSDGKTFLRPQRRIIVATVVAETGLTLDALKYVIDAGWNRASEVYFPDGRGLITKPAARSRIKQRRGRAGRKFPGEFHPLYTENVYNALDETQLPEIVTSGGASAFLDIVQATAASHGGVFRVGDLDLLDPPPCDALAASLECAVRGGYLRADPAERGHRLTRLGETASRFGRLVMEQSQTLLSGFLWGAALPDLAFIVTLYDQRSVALYELGGGDSALATAAPSFFRGGSRAKVAERVRAAVADDFIEALLVFDAFAEAVVTNFGGAALREWCEARGLSYDGCVAAAASRDAVMDELVAAGVNPFWGEELRLAAAGPEQFRSRVAALKRCIWAGLRASELRRVGPRTYATISGRPVHVGAFDGESAPRGCSEPPLRIVTNWPRIRAVRKGKKERVAPLAYRLQAGLVSVLDCFVGDDAGLAAPRAPTDGAAGPTPEEQPAASATTYARLALAATRPPGVGLSSEKARALFGGLAEQLGGCR